jgi:putative endonuclease
MTRAGPDAELPSPERQVAFRLGLSAETRAAAFMLAKGYRIAARRWRSPVGEVDLVVRRGRVLVFVEVKARVGFDAAAEAVTPRQQRRIAAAAAAWLASHPDDANCDIRFDVVLVAPWRFPRHIQAAFDAGP